MPRPLFILATLLAGGALATWWLLPSATKEPGARAAAAAVRGGGETVIDAPADRGAGPVLAPVPATPPAAPETPGAIPEGAAPDFTGIAIELVRARELRALPMTPRLLSRDEVSQRIAGWLARQFPGNHGMREGRALAALGAIPEAVDTVALRASFWSHQIGAWFDSTDETLALVERGEAADARENALGLAFAHLFREHGASLFPVARQAPEMDGWMARLGLIAGDAAFTRLRHALAYPAKGGGGGVGDDPDDPSREVPIPQFLRDRELAAFGVGMDFVRKLHELGKFEQVNAAYERPPVSCLELLEPSLYLAETQFKPQPVPAGDLTVDGAVPFWNGTLGVISLVLLLQQHVPQPLAADTAPGWRGDRLVVYRAGAGGRDHAVWQTLWHDSNAADAFFSAMRQALLSRYRGAQPARDAPADVFQLAGPTRFVRLSRTTGGRGILLVDAADEPFANALWEKFAGISKEK